MMTIEDLLLGSQPQIAVRPPEVDPLREVDTLQEAQLLDVRISVLGSAVGLLLELRTSLQFDEGNAALLVVRGLRDLQWHGVQTLSPITAFTVVSSKTSNSETGPLRVELGMFPSGSLRIDGIAAEFHVMDVTGIGEAPPDYSDGFFEGIKNSLPSWSSQCSLLLTSHLVVP